MTHQWVFRGALILFLSLAVTRSGLAESGNLDTPTLRRSDTSTLRLISLKPNITEILFALGVGDKVVGVTTWCDYPPEAKSLPKTADYINIDTEKIIALEPDLVIGSEENSIREQLTILNNAGIATMTVPFGTLDELYASVEKIAKAVGREREGKKLVARIKSVIASVPRNDMPTVIILVGKRPLVAAGSATFLSDIAAAAGAENLVTARVPAYPTINTEFMLARNPDVVLDLTMGSELGADLPGALMSKMVKLDMSEFRAGPRIGAAVKKIRDADRRFRGNDGSLGQ